jgi:hypothetical protein
MPSPAIEAARLALDRYRLPLLLTAIYDGLLGLVFLFFSDPIFRSLGVEPPANPVYVQLAAGLIAIMGLGFYLAWRAPLVNTDLVLVGTVFKAFYVVLAIYAQIRGQIPHGLFLLFAAIDAAFLLIFLSYLRDASAVRAALENLVSGRTAA